MNDFIKHLTKERERLLSLLSSIDNLLKEYSQYGIEAQSLPKNAFTLESKNTNDKPVVDLPAEISKYKGYSLRESVKLVVFGLDRFTKVTDILQILLNLYPEKRTNIFNFQVQVSGVLSDWGKKGDIVKYQFSSSKKDTAWGKKEWLDEKGKPKEEYKPSLK
jgi:hypothetical protein